MNCLKLVSVFWVLCVVAYGLAMASAVSPTPVANFQSIGHAGKSAESAATSYALADISRAINPNYHRVNGTSSEQAVTGVLVSLKDCKAEPQKGVSCTVPRTGNEVL